MLIDIINGASDDSYTVLLKILSILEGDITVNEMNRIRSEFLRFEFSLISIYDDHDITDNGSEVIIAEDADGDEGGTEFVQMIHAVMFADGSIKAIERYQLLEGIFRAIFRLHPPDEHMDRMVIHWSPKHDD